MAEMFKRVNGKKFEEAIASLDGVQDWLDEYIFEAGVKAEQELLDHRYEGDAFIEIEQGDIDRYLILNDERGQKAAMSIEYGREAYEKEDKFGNKRKVGAMEGLFILHNAVRLRGGKHVKIRYRP